ncbi:MAG TPA: type II toxin-antitoxin system HicA family toxin [Candidatus Brocadiia bacterium]|nr:type II toxin-antitoxin system HicA family toxin [Candidatus Brocadiales bacterium]
MAKLSNLPTNRVLKAFQRAGWQIETTGHKNPKHTVLSREGSNLILSIPRHRTVKKGLLLKLIKKAGLTVYDFLKLYK